jgi:uncharacterized protein (TIGR02391 family)
MDQAFGPGDLDHFEDRLLCHLVDLGGMDRPLPINAMVPEADLHQRMASELSHQVEGQPVDPRSILLEGLQELERHGYADLHKVMGPWGARPTRAGRERVLAWRRRWQKNRDRRTDQAILEQLDAQRRARPERHMIDARVDVPGLLEQAGIPHDEYLTSAQRLRQQGKIADSSIDQMSLTDGWAHITESGVGALERSSGLPEPRGGEAERAWNEVARLRKRIDTLVQEPVSLIRDAELAARCADLLAADTNHDRVMREACTILENRVRHLTGSSAENAVSVMQQAFSSGNPLIRLSDHEREQQGAMEIYTGVMRLFRNGVAHRLDSTITQESALQFVVMVDLLLALIHEAGPVSPTDEAALAQGTAES